MKFLTVFGMAVLAWLSSFSAMAVDYDQVGRDLASDGAVGWIHGAVNANGLYVFTYRNPQNFFDYAVMSVVTFDPNLLHQLDAVKRHDQVRLKGSFLPNPSPQKHILITSVEMVKPFVNPYNPEPYQHEAKIPDDLLNLNTATFLVHAVAGDGHVLVVEYKDGICPIYVQNADLAKNLYRNDVVKLKFKVQTSPSSPTHLALDEAAVSPVQVLDSVVAKHGKHVEMEGALILFPKSPEINVNIFAIDDPLDFGLHRQLTLTNLSNMDVFQAIGVKLQAAWDRYPGQFTNGRNKLLSKVLRVRVKGTYNEVDPSQANAQVFLNSADDVEILESH